MKEIIDGLPQLNEFKQEMNNKTTGKKTETNTTSTSNNTTSSINNTRKIPFLSKRKPQTTSDVNTLGKDLSNMKVTQDKSKEPASTSSTSSSKDKEKDKKLSTTANSKLKPLKEEKDRTPYNEYGKHLLRVNGAVYAVEEIVGNGSFGVVIKATDANGEEVAIKKVLQDKRYKNRELQIMQTISHPNIVELKNHFYTDGEKNQDELYLNLVLEFIPDTVYRVARSYSKVKQPIPLLYVKLYTYQLLRSLGYIHAVGICHRDIKPQNLLLNTQTSVLKLCDFGSAKVLVKGEPNVAYICSRYYRAPELVFGATNYTTAIDVWSAGCVLAELLLGQPLFPGESGVDQLVEIIKVLGTPTREEIQAMNPTYTEYKFPQIKGSPWAKVFRSRQPEAIDLVSKLLQYTPTSRLKPFEALAHPFFDDLRQTNANSFLPSGKKFPPLFNFSEIELKECGKALADKLLPNGQPVFPTTNGTSTSTPSTSTSNPSSSVSTTTSATTSTENSTMSN